MLFSARGPTSEWEFFLSVPPGTIMLMFGLLISWLAILKAFVMTLIASSVLRFLAISMVVVPESRIIVSPGFTRAAAFLPMRIFSA